MQIEKDNACVCCECVCMFGVRVVCVHQLNNSSFNGGKLESVAREF